MKFNLTSWIIRYGLSKDLDTLDDLQWILLARSPNSSIW